MTKQFTTSTTGAPHIPFGMICTKAAKFLASLFTQDSTPDGELSARLRHDIGVLDRNPDLTQGGGQSLPDISMEMMRRSF